jgi:hypothetical protein
LFVVGINQVTAPANGGLVGFALAFRTAQRLPHIRTLVHTADGGAMSSRAGPKIRLDKLK